MTVNLAGALPKKAALEIREMSQCLARLEGGERLRLQRRILASMEAWLHRQATVRHLARPEAAEVVVNAIDHREAAGVWQIIEYVVMPNHVHLFFQTAKNLCDVMIPFKRWTGHECNRLLGRQGDVFWQREWFDHWSRSVEEDRKAIEYIRENPVRAGLVREYTDWPYGSWAG